MRYRILFLMGATAAALSTFAADRTLVAPAELTRVRFSTDGKTISATSRDRHIRTWDVASGKLIKDKEVPPGTAIIAPDVVAEHDRKENTIRLWDLSAERQMQLLSGAPSRLTTVSRDRSLIATSNPEARTVALFDAAGGAQKKVLQDGIGGASVLAISPDNQSLVSANYDNDIRIWKIQSGELVKKMEDMTGAMFAGEFTADGKQLIMAGLDETVYIWDAKTFALLRKLKGHGETIASLAISPDGKTLVTGGFDVVTTKNPVKLAFWDLASGKITRSVRAPHQVASVAFSPDGKWVAITTGDKEVLLWSTNGGSGSGAN